MSFDDAIQNLEWAAGEVAKAKQAQVMGSKAWVGFSMAARGHAQQAVDQLAELERAVESRPAPRR
jgi:hypothetical protein